MVTMSATERAGKNWEDANLIDYDGYFIKGPKSAVSDNMRRRGYDGFIISKKKTSKHGHDYRRVYGIVLSPNYSKGRSYPLYPSLKTYPQGYVKASRSQGTAQLFGGMAYHGQTFDKKILEKLFKEAQRGK